MSENLEVTGIPYEELMIPRYYLASATIGNTTKTAKFSITLCPMGVEVEEPDWEETDEEFLLVSEDGNYEYTVYSPDEEVVLKVIPLDTSGILSSLWDEEQKMYAEYAAGVLMKYNAGTNNRVLEGQKLIQQEAKEEAQKIRDDANNEAKERRGEIQKS